MEPLELAKFAARILDEKKAVDIRALKVRDLTVLADYFVLASGTSSTHVASLAGEIEHKLGEEGVKPLRTEGLATREWVLLDYGSVLVHLFYPDSREFYALEHLWADADPIQLELTPD